MSRRASCRFATEDTERHPPTPEDLEERADEIARMGRQIEGLVSAVQNTMARSDDEPWEGEEAPRLWSYYRGMRDGLMWAAGLLQRGADGNEYAFSRFSLLNGGEFSDDDHKPIFHAPESVATLVAAMLREIEEEGGDVPIAPEVTYYTGDCRHCGWDAWLHPTTADFPGSRPTDVHDFSPLPKDLVIELDDLE